MATLPRTKDGMIEYFEERLSKWQLDPGAVGLTAEQVDALAALVADARTSYTTVQQAKQDLRNMVFSQDTDIDTMMGLGSALLGIIRAHADATGVTDGNAAAAGVFAAANISPANARTPAPPPAPATNLQASLLNTGGLKLTWNGTTANGTVYALWRRTNNDTAFTQLATSGQRTYEDQTVPAGSAEVVYFLRTIRDNLVSDDAEPITVRLGVPLDLSNTEAGTDTSSTELGIAA